MAIGAITGALAGALSLGTNIYNTWQSHQNYKLQKQNMEWQQGFNERQFQYQQDLNKQIMEREDTSVQRRVSDLQAAGMSKWLAAGQGASSSVMSGSAGSSNSQAPSQAAQVADLGRSVSDAVNIYGSIQNTKTGEAQREDLLASADLKRTNAVTEINYTRNKIEADTNLNKQQRDNLIKQLDKLQQDIVESQSRTDLNDIITNTKGYDLLLSSLFSRRTTDELSQKYLIQLAQMLGGILGRKAAGSSVELPRVIINKKRY